MYFYGVVKEKGGKKVKKAFKVLASVILVLVMISSVMAISFVGAEEAAPLSSFAVQTTSGADSKEALGKVEWWYSSVDGKYYMFMPSSADLSSVTVWFDAADDVYCGNTKLENGVKTSVFANGGNYTLGVGDMTYDVVFITSSDLPSIFINTESGSLDSIHADKSHKEKGDLLAIDENGDTVYDNKLSSIKGRGNSTWGMAKKPYNIKLDKSTDLFGMGKAKNWCLIANYGDKSLVRNQIVYEVARDSGMTVTPDCINVDLYINGEYLGVYLVTEKVEIKENRVDIYDLEGETEDCNEKDLDSYRSRGFSGRFSSYLEGTRRWRKIPNNPENITGGYLLELELADRYPDEASGFVSDGGQQVVVKAPEYASKEQVKYISGYWQEMEDALYSDDGYNKKGKHFSEYLDLDSFALQYLIQEWTCNWDAGLTSNYFYKDIDGKIMSGPAWDFDTALLNSERTNAGYTPSDVTYWHARTRNLYYHSLMGYDTVKWTPNIYALGFCHDEVVDAVKKQWNDSFYGAVQELLNTNLDTYVGKVKDAAVMNAIRWNYYATTDVDVINERFASEINKVEDYIVRRTAALDENLDLDTAELKNDMEKRKFFSRLGETAVDFIEIFCYCATALFI